ncbi:MAG: sulfotransferase [Pseudomonadota bacterium]
MHAYPDFLIVGMMKAATTTIYEHLSKHPRVTPAKFKELHYFSRDFVALPPEGSWSYEYHELLNYDPNDASALTGEASPSYIAVPERIFAFNPNCKIIIIFREPVSRCISQFRQYKDHKLKHGSISDEILNTADLSTINFIHDSDYSARFKRFLETFPTDNILTLSFEAFVSDQQPAMDRVFQFLGLEPVIIDSDVVTSKTKPADDEHLVRKRLSEHFADKRGAVSSLIERYKPHLYPNEIEAFHEY